LHKIQAAARVQTQRLAQREGNGDLAFAGECGGGHVFSLRLVRNTTMARGQNKFHSPVTKQSFTLLF
jgi:hypothetical protein